jgi:hypothetical protein
LYIFFWLLILSHFFYDFSSITSLIQRDPAAQVKLQLKRALLASHDLDSRITALKIIVGFKLTKCFLHANHENKYLWSARLNNLQGCIITHYTYCIHRQRTILKPLIVHTHLEWVKGDSRYRLPVLLLVV